MADAGDYLQRLPLHLFHVNAECLLGLWVIERKEAGTIEVADSLCRLVDAGAYLHGPIDRGRQSLISEGVNVFFTFLRDRKRHKTVCLNVLAYSCCTVLHLYTSEIVEAFLHFNDILIGRDCIGPFLPCDRDIGGNAVVDADLTRIEDDIILGSVLLVMFLADVTNIRHTEALDGA